MATPVTTLNTFRVGGVLFGAQRSSDGKWEKDGQVLPWLSVRRWPNGEGGAELIVGPWAIGMIWKSRTNE